MVISMLKIRRPLGRLIFNMGIAIPGKTVFLIETAPRCRRWRPGRYCDNSRFSGFVAPAQVLNWILNQRLQNILSHLMLYIIYRCVYKHIYYLGFFVYYCTLCKLSLMEWFMCILLYMIMCMLLSATSTHFKWGLMLYTIYTVRR